MIKSAIPLAAILIGFGSQALAQSAVLGPSPEMVRLIKMMSGTWQTTLTYPPSNKLPNGATGQGKQVWHAGPGDLSLIEDESAITPTGRWDGMSVTWWDPAAKGFRAIWCDNHQATGCLVMEKIARWEGSNFVLGDEWKRGGKTMQFREVQSDIGPRSFVLTTYMGEAGKPLEKTLTVRAVRVTSAK